MLGASEVRTITILFKHNVVMLSGGVMAAGDSKRSASVAPHTIVIVDNGFGLCLYF